MMTDSIPDNTLPGMALVSDNRTVIEYVEWFQNYLTLPGRWNAINTGGRVPTVRPEDKARRLSFSRSDVVTIREEPYNSEPAAVTYGYVNKTAYLNFTVWTRISRMQVALMETELIRLLMLIRTDPFGNVPSEGRDWLKIVYGIPGQVTKRGYWAIEVRVELNIRWKPILTQGDVLGS